MKGMQRIRRGSGFGGVLRYVFGRDQDHQDSPGVLIGGNMLGADVRQLTREFSAVRALREDIGKPVWHNALRLPAGDKITPQNWVILCDDYMNRMGFTLDHPRVYVLHDDAEGQHVHLVASRVSVAGTVYLGQNENLRSTRIIQRLERIHHLTITPGPTYKEDRSLVLPPRKQVKKNEIEAALRTGTQPPRLQLQRILDATLAAGPQPVQRFVSALQAQGVTVIPNIASTGRLNGFAFEINGVAFKASQLGDAYKWSRLKTIVHYEQTQDHSALAELRASASCSTGPAAPARSHPAGVDAAVGRLGADAARTAPDHRPVESAGDAGNQPHPGAGTAVDPDATTDERTGHHHRIDAPERTDERPASPAQTHQSRSDTDRPSREADAANDAPSPAADPVASDRVDPIGSPVGRGPDNRWDIRFRRAASASRRAADAAVSPRIDAHAREDARQVDPTEYLQSQGFTVKSECRHWSVRDRAGDEAYRLTRKQDGHIVWCDHLGNEGGDLIALVQDIGPGTSFRDAVFALTRGAARLLPQAPAPSGPAEPLRLPTPTRPQQARGRAYLAERGISAQTIAHAESAGMLRYEAAGVLFVGYDDQRQPRSATLRRIQADAQPAKRDLRGSIKAFCPILPGNPSMVWIVEGGVDALAIQDAARSRGKTPPTVLVSGGAGVRSFLEREAIHAVLRQAQRIVISCDNEADRDIQARTDGQHQQQAERVREIAPTAETRLWHPPARCKDIAQWHAQQAESSDVAPLPAAPSGETKTPPRDMTRTPDGATPSSIAGGDDRPV